MTLNVIVSSIFTVSPSVSLNPMNNIVISSSIVTESSTKYSDFAISKSSTDTVSNTE